MNGIGPPQKSNDGEKGQKGGGECRNILRRGESLGKMVVKGLKAKDKGGISACPMKREKRGTASNYAHFEFFREHGSCSTLIGRVGVKKENAAKRGKSVGQKGGFEPGGGNSSRGRLRQKGGLPDWGKGQQKGSQGGGWEDPRGLPRGNVDGFSAQWHLKNGGGVWARERDICRGQAPGGEWDNKT